MFSTKVSFMLPQEQGTPANALPAGGVTGVGSLPHVEVDAAIDFVERQSGVIPFWPQLPRRGSEEDGIVQTLSPLMHLLRRAGPAHIDLFPGRLASFLHLLRDGEVFLDSRHATGFYAFEQAAKAGRFADAQWVKGHLYGPATLTRCLYVDSRPIADGAWVDRTALYAAVGDYVVRMARWQVERLRALGKPVLLVIDEPALALDLNDSLPVYVLGEVIERLRAPDVCIGIHCCALPVPISLLAAKPDLVSFDAFQGLEGFVNHPAFNRYVTEGGLIAWGVVPTLNNLQTSAIDELVQRWLRTVRTCDLDLPQLLRQSLFTATCGLGLLEEGAAEQIFADTRLFAGDVMHEAQIRKMAARIALYRSQTGEGR